MPKQRGAFILNGEDRGVHRLGGVREPLGAYQGPRGQEGSQSGIAEESDLMRLERSLQSLAGWGTLGMSGLGGFFGGPLGAPVTGAGFVAGANTVRNADEPNIRDVWTDKLRRQMQGR
jgi:hypothetical protein